MIGADEPTAEFEAGVLAPPTELRIVPRVTVAAKTDLGRVRENNEDKFEFYIPEDVATLANRGLTFIVCDGMGGHAAGQIASELACKTFIEVYLNHPAQDVQQALRAAAGAANRFVLDISRAVAARRGMGTTLSALTLVQDQAYFAHVGDSRIYRSREGQLEQMTFDHTMLEEHVRAGVPREIAEANHNKHMLTRAIGTEDNLPVDVVAFDLRVGDRFLLCSDGLTNHVDDATIGKLLAECSPAEGVWKLVGLALQGGGSDNCTALAVRVDALESRI